MTGLTLLTAALAIISMVFNFYKMKNLERRVFKAHDLSKSIYLYTADLWSLYNTTSNRVDKISGKLEKYSRKAAMSEKFAERAFTMSNQAHLGLLELGRTLPRVKSQTNPKKNQDAYSKIQAIINPDGDDFTEEWLRPIMSESEWDLYRHAKEQYNKGIKDDSETIS